MEGDSPSNIFEAAGGKELTKKEPPKKPPLPDEEIDARLERVNKYRDEVDQQISSLGEKMGLSLKEITQILENPQNLNAGQQKIREEMQKRLETMLAFQKQTPETKQKKKKTESDDASVKRKGKTLGGRKGWLSM